MEDQSSQIAPAATAGDKVLKLVGETSKQKRVYRYTRAQMMTIGEKPECKTKPSCLQYDTSLMRREIISNTPLEDAGHGPRDSSLNPATSPPPGTGTVAPPPSPAKGFVFSRGGGSEDRHQTHPNNRGRGQPATSASSYGQQNRYERFGTPSQRAAEAGSDWRAPTSADATKAALPSGDSAAAASSTTATAGAKTGKGLAVRRGLHITAPVREGESAIAPPSGSPNAPTATGPRHIHFERPGKAQTTVNTTGAPIPPLSQSRSPALPPAPPTTPITAPINTHEPSADPGSLTLDTNATSEERRILDKIANLAPPKDLQPAAAITRQKTRAEERAEEIMRARDEEKKKRVPDQELDPLGLSSAGKDIFDVDSLFKPRKESEPDPLLSWNMSNRAPKPAESESTPTKKPLVPFAFSSSAANSTPSRSKPEVKQEKPQEPTAPTLAVIDPAIVSVASSQPASDKSPVPDQDLSSKMGQWFPGLQQQAPLPEKLTAHQAPAVVPIPAPINEAPIPSQGAPLPLSALFSGQPASAMQPPAPIPQVLIPPPIVPSAFDAKSEEEQKKLDQLLNSAFGSFVPEPEKRQGPMLAQVGTQGNPHRRNNQGGRGNPSPSRPSNPPVTVPQVNKPQIVPQPQAALHVQPAGQPGAAQSTTAQVPAAPAPISPQSLFPQDPAAMDQFFKMSAYPPMPHPMAMGPGMPPGMPPFPPAAYMGHPVPFGPGGPRIAFAAPPSPHHFMQMAAAMQASGQRPPFPMMPMPAGAPGVPMPPPGGLPSPTGGVPPPGLAHWFAGVQPGPAGMMPPPHMGMPPMPGQMMSVDQLEMMVARK